MTPFISGRKLMLKYHSSWIAKGLTPRRDRVLGNSAELRLPHGIARPQVLVIRRQSTPKFLTSLVLRHLDGEVDAHQADAAVHIVGQQSEAILLDERMAVGSIGVEEDAAGAIEGLLAIGPAAAVDGRFQGRGRQSGTS